LLHRTSCARTFAIAGAFLVSFAKNARQFSLGVNLGEIVALFFDVKLVVAQETENLCGLLNESLRNKHEKCPTT
jgi:hypothetical protein